MTTYAIPLNNGIEISTHIVSALQGYRAHSLAFNSDADIVAETSSLDTHYIDYCVPEIIGLEIFKMFPDIEPSLLWDSLDTIGLLCNCGMDIDY